MINGDKRVPANFLGTVRVLPRVPAELAGLEDLAYNLWWAWNPYARQLFRAIHSETWIHTDGNPVRFMNHVSQSALDAAAKNPEVLALYDSVMKQLDAYMRGDDSWFAKTKGHPKGWQVAYFSAEYGINESLPIYSGGLGVLAGDHCKSASDLGLPFMAVGLLYRDGYFVQKIDSDGQQQAIYEYHDWRDLPVTPALDKRGNQVVVSVELAGRTLYAKVWKVQVGRIALHLLDSDVEPNTVEERRLTARLYGGNEETRIQQEILLGIGGVRALKAMGYEPSVYHMNEGHSVFLGLERLREFIQDHGLKFAEAIELVRSTTLFTTHTPVPAGNDAFAPGLIDKYFRSFWESIGLTRAQFLALGLDTMQDGTQRFSLTVLALNLSAMANGVSELHGMVSRAMWQHVWADVPAEESPIRHITNGIHTRTFLSLDMQQLIDKYFAKDWRERLDEPEIWKAIDKVPDEELWAVISKLRSDMVEFVHRRLTSQHTRFGETPENVREWGKCLQPGVLTIGFARRFATYKRATLIFRNKERLARILNNPERPIQIAFSGKAHPADLPGQSFIKAIQMISREEAFRGKVVFLENYDINVARRLTSGVDVWLNNPRRPLEASGTSGMKVPLNGGLNCSIQDGWWREAYLENPLSGWSIGPDANATNDENHQDDIDAEIIYQVLENEIAPTFYDRDAAGIPREWLKRVRESMKTVSPFFSTHRMVKNYGEMFYFPGCARNEVLRAGRFDRVRKNAAWRDTIRSQWPSIRIAARVDATVPVQTIRVSEKIQIVAEVDLGPIDPDFVEVQIYTVPVSSSLHGNGNGNGAALRTSSIPMRPDGKNDKGLYIYRGGLLEGDSGEFNYTVRVVPKHPDLVHPMEMGLVSWCQPGR